MLYPVELGVRETSMIRKCAALTRRVENQVMGIPLGLVYFVLVGAILYASIKHRKDGWLIGFLFGLLLLTLPLWVFGLIWLFGAWPN